MRRLQNRFEEAGKALEEALTIRRQLARQNPEAYSPSVAETLSELGNLRRVQKLIRKGRQAYDEALGIYEKFAELNWDRYNGDVARIKVLLKDLDEKAPIPK